MSVKRQLVRCTHCGHAWLVARPKKDEQCPMCKKTGVKPIALSN